MAQRESEFGEVLASVQGGDVIRLEEQTSTHRPGDIVFISGAFNLLDISQLTEILIEMEKH